jgi:hypothetical protein
VYAARLARENWHCAIEADGKNADQEIGDPRNSNW